MSKRLEKSLRDAGMDDDTARILANIPDSTPEEDKQQQLDYEQWLNDNFVGEEE